MKSPIRKARPDDAPALLEIYRPLVEETAVSFESAVPSVATIERRISTVLTQHPWLVWEDGTTQGYAYATPYRSRDAYRWSVEVSVYLATTCRRAGVGRQLYGALFRLLKAQGVANAYAGIALPNPASVGFHEALGFEHVGIFRQVGWKHGAWHDVGWWQKRLREGEPVPIRPVDYSLL